MIKILFHLRYQQSLKTVRNSYTLGFAFTRYRDPGLKKCETVTLTVTVRVTVSCEQLQTVMIFFRQSFVPTSGERGLNLWSKM